MMTRVQLPKNLTTNQCSFHPILINLHKSKELFLISPDFLYLINNQGNGFLTEDPMLMVICGFPRQTMMIHFVGRVVKAVIKPLFLFYS